VKKAVLKRNDVIRKHSFHFKVHDVNHILIPQVKKPLEDDNLSEDDSIDDMVSDAMKLRICKWGQGLFQKYFWTSAFVWQFEILSQFLYSFMEEDDIDILQDWLELILFESILIHLVAVYYNVL